MRTPTAKDLASMAAPRSFSMAKVSLAAVSDGGHQHLRVDSSGCD